jgi:hypothetical protein
MHRPRRLLAQYINVVVHGAYEQNTDLERFALAKTGPGEPELCCASYRWLRI